MRLTAKLLPIWTPELGAAGMSYSDRFNVTFAGEIIVERSRDPETDLARALLARGHHGKVTLVHGETGKLQQSSTSKRRPRCAPWKRVLIPASDALKHVQR